MGIFVPKRSQKTEKDRKLEDFTQQITSHALMIKKVKTRILQ